MLEGVNRPRTAINWRGAVVAALVGTAVLGATGAAQAHDWKKQRYYYYAQPGYYAPPGYVVVPPGHVRYYAPAPVIYAAPPPVVVYPEPVVYGPAYGPPSLNLGITLPLR